MNDPLYDAYNPAALDQQNAAAFREEMRAERQAARDSGAAAATDASSDTPKDAANSLIKHRLDPRAIAAGTLGGPLGWIILATWKTLGWVHHEKK